MKKQIIGVIIICLLLSVFMIACGDGEKCDCCDNDFDCKTGLRCVDLQGGSGKVCGEQGINYCDHNC